MLTSIIRARHVAGLGMGWVGDFNVHASVHATLLGWVWGGGVMLTFMLTSSIRARYFAGLGVGGVW